MFWLVKHQLRDQSIETFRYDSDVKARRICSDLREATEIAWIQDEHGRVLPGWDDPQRPVAPTESDPGKDRDERAVEARLERGPRAQSLS